MKRYLMMLAAVDLGVEHGLGPGRSRSLQIEMCHVSWCDGRRKSWTILQKTALTQQQITDLLTNGAAGKKAPHTKAMSGLTAAQAGEIATYVGTLKK